MKRTLEADYQRALLARASLTFRDVRIFKRSTGVIKVEDRMFRAGIKGQADLYAISRGGQHYEIELKRFSKLTEAQEQWAEWCRSWGIPWLLLEARKDESPIATVNRWIEELGAWWGGTAGSERQGDTNRSVRIGSSR